MTDHDFINNMPLNNEQKMVVLLERIDASLQKLVRAKALEDLAESDAPLVGAVERTAPKAPKARK